MKLFGLTIIKSKNISALGCQYSGKSDSICTYLSKIVDYQNAAMFKEFVEQKQLIIKNHEVVLKEFKKQDAQNQSDKKEYEKRFYALERYFKPTNMAVFDAVMRYKWVVIVWVIGITVFEAVEIVLYFMK